MANITPTRRSMLGAMALAPVVIAAPAQAIASNGEWYVLKGRLDAATAASNRHTETVLRRFWSESSRIFGPGMICRGDPRIEAYREWSAHSGYDRECDISDRLGSNEADLRISLLKMPAPDKPALLYKLEATLDGNGDWGDEVRDAVLADARRLLAGAN